MEDTPTAVLVRQVLGAIAQFEKASLVAKLKADRTEVCGYVGVGGERSVRPLSAMKLAGREDVLADANPQRATLLRTA